MFFIEYNPQPLILQLFILQPLILIILQSLHLIDCATQERMR